VLGGSGGYALTVAAWRILPAVAPASIPRLATARADWTILAFAMTVALASGLLFGIAPALRSSATGLGARGAASEKHDRLRGALVAGEVAITLTLVLTGGRFLAGFVDLLGKDAGFEADRVLASVVLPPLERYPTPEQRDLLFRKFVESVRTLPGVQTAGVVDALPFSGENHGGYIAADPAGITDPNARMIDEVDVVGGDYLQSMGVRLREGRWFQPEETRSSSDVAIVDEIAAQRLWPRGKVLGKRLCVNCSPQNPNNWKRVVGVVAATRHVSLDGPAEASVYLAAGGFARAQFLVVRTSRPPADLIPAVRRAIAGVDPNQPVLFSVPLNLLIGDTIADRRFIVELLAATGILALILAMAGVYGVLSYTTSRRTQEIGVRMALGATPQRIHAMVFGQGMTTVTAGFVLGLGATAATVRILRGVLVGLEGGSAAGIWIAACLVAVTAAAGCWIPVRRAMRIDPMAALRGE